MSTQLELEKHFTLEELVATLNEVTGGLSDEEEAAGDIINKRFLDPMLYKERPGNLVSLIGAATVLMGIERVLRTKAGIPFLLIPKRENEAVQ